MQLRHAPLCRRRRKACQTLLRRRFVDEPGVPVKTRLVLARLPACTELAALMVEAPLDLKVIDRLESFDLALAAHDERQGRRLDPAHGQNEFLVPCTACRERIGARKVHADEPVGAGTRQRRLLERVEVAVLAKIRIRLADALLVERVQKDALDGLFVADEIEHLVDQKLPLAVGVARMDDLIGTRDEILDDAELPRCRRRNDELPLGGHDGQILRAPELVLLAVLLRLLLSQDMTEAPRHRAFRRFQPSVVRAHRAFEALGNLAPHARFLRNVEPQDFSSFPCTAIFYESPRSPQAAWVTFLKYAHFCPRSGRLCVQFLMQIKYSLLLYHKSPSLTALRSIVIMAKESAPPHRRLFTPSEAFWEASL